MPALPGGAGANRFLAPLGQVQQAADQRRNDVLLLGGAEIEHQAGMGLEAAPTGLFDELGQQPGLADSRLPAQHQGFARATLLTAVHDVGEQALFPTPADEAVPLAVLLLADAVEAPDGDRRRQPLDPALPQIHADEAMAERPVDRGRDQRLPRRGQVGEAGGQVQAIAGDGVLDMRRAARGAGQHLAGSDADMDVERRLQPGDLLMDGSGRAQRAFGIVGGRHRRAEDRHHRVADVLVDGGAISVTISSATLKKALRRACTFSAS